MLVVILCAVLAYPAWTIYFHRRVMADNERTAVLVKCAMNEKAIGVALAAYLRDHSDVYPDTVDSLVPYLDLNDKRVLTCPAKGGGPRSASSGASVPTDYLYLAGGLKGPLPPDVVVLIDARENHGEDAVNILYADGTADYVSRTLGLGELFEQIESGKRPVVRPRR